MSVMRMEPNRLSDEQKKSSLYNEQALQPKFNI